MAQFQTIGRSEQVKVIARAVVNWVNSLTDALPPYYVAKGRLDMKGKADDGRLRIHVNGAWLSVDKPTFELLAIGEYVRVRYTRRVRAISIDRYVSRNGH
jgi:hypothetical protein